VGQRRIRAFLKVRTSYDVLPLSFRLIVFDTALLVKKSLNILIQNGEQDKSIATTELELTLQDHRHCLRAVMGFEDVDLCGPPHDLRLH
jgi:hypothetical protein